MTTTTMNGNVRKSLADQIDRLDTILNGLAESLSGAVAEALRENVGLAVKEAVQAVLIEVLGNPAVLAKLHAAAGPPPAAESPKRSCVARVASWVKDRAQRSLASACEACASARDRVAQAPGAMVQCARVAWGMRKPLVIAIGAGVLSGVLAFTAGPWVAATAGTVAGFTAACAAQLAATLRRMLATYTSPDNA
jgi:hypothetical protein